jgi:hypothetical protein
MAVDCPAQGCDFEGMVDAVAGHIGGKTDNLHAGVVPDRVGGGLPSENSTGLSTTQIVVIVAVVVLVFAVEINPSGEASRAREEDRREGVARGAF